MSKIDVLRRISLFADLNDETLIELAGRLGKRTFGADMILFHKGSPSQALYMIESGRVRSFALSDQGREVTLDIYGPGECFGETALVDGQVRTTGAMTLEPTVAYTLQQEEFLRCLEEHPGLARRALELLAERLNHLTAFTENLAFLDAPGRVASVLLELAARYSVNGGGIEIALHLTQSELATWCVVSRVMVNRVLCSFRDEELIKVERQTITILDLSGLKRKMTP